MKKYILSGYCFVLVVLLPLSCSAEDKKVVCEAYSQCMEMADKIGNNSLRTPEDEELAKAATLRAFELASPESYEKYYAAARHYSWNEGLNQHDPRVIENLEKAVQVSPEKPEAKKWLMWRYRFDNKCDKAIQIIDTIFIESRENYRDSLDLLGANNCNNTSKGIEYSIKFIDKRLQLGDLQFEDVMNLMIFDKDGLTAPFYNDIDKFTDKQIQKHKDSFLLYYLKGINTKIYDKKKALKYIEKACQLAPKDFKWIATTKVEILQDLGRNKEALEEINKLIGMDGKKDYLVNRAKVYKSLKQYNQAKKDLIIACDNKVIFSCEALTEFTKDEARGWNWAYASTNKNQEKIFFNKQTIKSKSGVKGIWLRFESADDSRTKYVEINCKTGTINQKDGSKNNWIPIDPGSVYVDVQNEACGR